MSAARIARGVGRGTRIAITVNGERIACFAGETVAAAMLAAGHIAFHTDSRGHRRGMFCNMGSCCECLVTLVGNGRRVRACLLEAHDGMEIAAHG